MPVSLTKDLEPDHATGDALLQHRPARDAPRRIRAGHRAGRSGSGGVAVACALGQLDSRSRDLPPSFRLRPRGSLARASGSSDPLSWQATSRRSTSLACFPSNGGPIGGQHGQPDTNQMNLQPIASIFFGEGWSLGYSGNILANWNAPSEDVWTVPVGLGLAKVVKLGTSAHQGSARGAVYAGASPDIRTGVERAGVDHSCPSEAH